MNHRCLARTGAVAVVSMAPVLVARQAQSASTTTAAAWMPPRTPDGQPDLQGIWNFDVSTPFERPKELAGRQALTDQEVAQREEQADQRLIDSPPREGDPGTYNKFWFERSRVTRQLSLVVDPPDGIVPPLTPEVQKRQAALAEARRGVADDAPTPGGWVEDIAPRGPSVRCLLGLNSGPPMVPSAYNMNVQLFQTPDYVVILNEMIHNARIVPLDGRPHLPPHMRQWTGDSRGRWEGNTLVVDTTNFTNLVRNFRFGGTFRTGGANTHLVERFTRSDADTLLYEFTVDDPMTWTRPWTAQIPMSKSQSRMYEYACHEGNYALPGILAGARAQEKDAEAAKN